MIMFTVGDMLVFDQTGPSRSAFVLMTENWASTVFNTLVMERINIHNLLFENHITMVLLYI